MRSVSVLVLLPRLHFVFSRIGRYLCVLPHHLSNTSRVRGFHSRALLSGSHLLRFTRGHSLNWRALPAGCRSALLVMCGGGEAWLGWISMTGPFSSTVLLMGQLRPFNRPIYIEMRGQEGGRAEACAWLKSIPNQRPKRGGPLRGSDTSLFSAALVPSASHKGFKHPTLTTALISTTQLFTFLSHRVSVGAFWNGRWKRHWNVY